MPILTHQEKSMLTMLRFPSFIALALISSGLITSPSAFADKGKDKARFKFNTLEAPAGASVIQPTAANRDGWIAGYYVDTSGLHAFVKSGKKFKDAGLPSTDAYTIDTCVPVGLSANGVVAGMAYDTNGYGHAYTRAGNTITEIVYPDSQPGGTQIRAMSSDGKILGDASLTVEPYFVTFVYKNGVFTPLSLPPNPPAPDIYWTSINNRGQLLGAGNSDSGRIYVVATANGYRVLPALPGNYEANAITLTNSGDVALDAFDLDNYLGPDFGNGTVGFLFTERRWVKVQAPKDSLGLTHISGASDLDDGDDLLIVGNYWDATLAKYVAYTARLKD